jgi:hypothetical protein
MTTLHVQLVGGQAFLPLPELERLIELARQCEPIDVQSCQDDLHSLGLSLLAQQGGAFDWLAEEEDQYSLDDLKVRYR